MILRDALDIRRGTAQRNKIYKGTYKVWDRNKIALEGYCKQELLPSEYRQVEYIEKNGGQYIDLNETATIDCEIGIDCYIANYNSGNKFIMGCRASGCSAIIGVQPSLVYQFGAMSSSTFTKNITLNQRYRIVANNTGCYVDDELYYSYSGGMSVNESTNHIKLFATSNKTDGVEFSASDGTKMYSAYVKKNGIYTRNLIPCYRKSDNEIGMYDIVNNVFYTNAGTGTFTKGADIPNPDYPQEIEVMEGRQVVIVEKNHFNGIYTNGYIGGADGKTYQNENTTAKIAIVKCLPNTEYIIKKGNSNRFRIADYPSYPQNGNIVNVLKTDDTLTETTITTNLNAQYLLIYVSTSTEQATPNMTVSTTENLIVDLKSKNICNPESSYNVNASAGLGNAEGEFPLTTGGNRGTYFFECEPNTTYTISYKTKGDRLAIYEHYSIINPLNYTTSNKLILDHLIAGYSSEQTVPSNGYTFTTGENAKMVAIYYSLNTKPTEFQIEKNSEATSYEPYYDYKLAGIGDYKDNIFTDKGKWYFKQNIRKMILNGNESWIRYPINQSKFQFYIQNADLNVKHSTTVPSAKSNYFVSNVIGNRAGAADIVYTITNGLAFSLDDISTLEDWKTWLSTYNPELYYILSEPIITEIPSTYTTLINQLNALYQAL